MLTGFFLYRRSHRHRRPAPPLPDPPALLPQRPSDPEPPVSHVESVDTTENQLTDPPGESPLIRWVRNVWRKNSSPNESLNTPPIAGGDSIATAQPGTEDTQNILPGYSRPDTNPGNEEDDDFDTEPLIESQP